MSDVILSVSDIIEAAFQFETPHNHTVNFRLLKTLLVILANQLRVINRRVLVSVDSGTTLPKPRDHPSLVVSEIKVQTEDVNTKKNKSEKKKNAEKRSEGKKGKGKTSEEKKGEEKKSERKEAPSKSRSKEKDDTTQEDLLEKTRFTKSASQFNVKITSDESIFADNERDAVSLHGERDNDSIDTERTGSLHAGVTLHRSSEDDLAELRERELRIIKQRTDSHEEPNICPTPMVSVHSITKENILVVTPHGHPTSVNVVTADQFNVLANAVRDLQSRYDPIGTPFFQENTEFLKALRKGASLTDAMTAFQLSARFQAMETAFVKIMSLLTEVAKKTPGVDVTKFQKLETQIVKGNQQHQSEHEQLKKHDEEPQRNIPGDWVSREEFDHMIHQLREDFGKKSKSSPDRQVRHEAKAKEHKAHQQAIKNLETKINKCTEKLNSVDLGVTAQVKHFQEYLIEMQNNLETGIESMADKVAHLHSDPEAMGEFNGRLELLQQDAEYAMLDQNNLRLLINNITLDLAKLWKEIEILRDVKADREEVIDILRDKAGLEHLNKMVTEDQFMARCAELESKIKASNNKFNDQELVWQRALDDLVKVINEKGDWLHICRLRDEINYHLNSLKRKVDGLIEVVGEPRAAVVMKKLFRDAKCVSCGHHADMNMEVPVQRLPDFKRAADHVAEGHIPKAHGDHKPCAPNQPVPRGHVCHRFCGGSHTLMPHLTPVPPGVTVTNLSRNVTTTVGSDGQAYYTDELQEMKPCDQCKHLEDHQPTQTEKDVGSHPATNIARKETSSSSMDIMREMSRMAERHFSSEAPDDLQPNLQLGESLDFTETNI